MTLLSSGDGFSNFAQLLLDFITVSSGSDEHQAPKDGQHDSAICEALSRYYSGKKESIGLEPVLTQKPDKEV